MNYLHVNGLPISAGFIYTRLVFVVCWEIMTLTASEQKMITLPVELSQLTYLLTPVKVFTFLV